MSDPREDKLPVWAKSLLSLERARADKAAAKLAAHLTTIEPTPIWYGNYDNPIHVPVDYGYQTVYYSTTGEPTKASHLEIGVAYRKGVISVQGGSAVIIQPTASNCFDISLRKW